MSRWYISRRALLACSTRGPDGAYRVGGLEALARHLRLEPPHMPRRWHGYRLSLVAKISRWVSDPAQRQEWGR